MRHFLLTLVIFAVVGAPATAKAGPPTCDSITPADLEQITGLKLTAPSVDRLDVCGGLCEGSDGTSCLFSGSDDNPGAQVMVEIRLPPFLNMYNAAAYNAMRRATSGNDQLKPGISVQVLGRPAIWDFSAASSELHIFADPDLHLAIYQSGEDTEGSAFKKAEAIAALVLANK